jgi:hypothetical protein
MPKKFMSLLLGVSAVIGVSSQSLDSSATFEQFKSYAKAQEAVREAGPNGLSTHKLFYAVVYDELQC